MPRPRKILTPGEQLPVSAAGEAASGGADEIEVDEDFGGDDLPGEGVQKHVADQAGDGMVPISRVQAMLADQERRFQAQMAAAIAASRSARDPATAAALAARRLNGERLPTQDEALQDMQDTVASGRRPRSILSADGWVTVQAQTLSPASVGRTGALGIDGIQQPASAQA